MLGEETDHRGALLHRRDVAGESRVETGRRAGLRRGGCGTQNEGAQARDEGFQDVTSASETGHGARRSRAPYAEKPGACRSSIGPTRLAGAHKVRSIVLRKLHNRCHKRFRPVQRTFSSGATRNAPFGAFRRLRDRDSNPNFRSQNPASYH